MPLRDLRYQRKKDLHGKYLTSDLTLKLMILFYFIVFILLGISILFSMGVMFNLYDIISPRNQVFLNYFALMNITFTLYTGVVVPIINYRKFKQVQLLAVKNYMFRYKKFYNIGGKKEVKFNEMDKEQIKKINDFIKSRKEIKGIELYTIYTDYKTYMKDLINLMEYVCFPTLLIFLGIVVGIIFNNFLLALFINILLILIFLGIQPLLYVKSFEVVGRIKSLYTTVKEIINYSLLFLVGYFILKGILHEMHYIHDIRILDRYISDQKGALYLIIIFFIVLFISYIVSVKISNYKMYSYKEIAKLIKNKE